MKMLTVQDVWPFSHNSLWSVIIIIKRLRQEPCVSCFSFISPPYQLTEQRGLKPDNQWLLKGWVGGVGGSREHLLIPRFNADQFLLLMKLPQGCTQAENGWNILSILLEHDSRSFYGWLFQDINFSSSCYLSCVFSFLFFSPTETSLRNYNYDLDLSQQKE